MRGNGLTLTHRQGQFLAFIRLYTKLHRRAPAEQDIARYFGLTPPAVHAMIVKLDELGLITRVPGAARSVRVEVLREQLPELADIEGPPLRPKVVLKPSLVVDGCPLCEAHWRHAGEPTAIVCAEPIFLGDLGRFGPLARR